MILQQAKAELLDPQEAEAPAALQDPPAGLALRAPTQVVVGPPRVWAPAPSARVRGLEAVWGKVWADTFHGPLCMNYEEKATY